MASFRERSCHQERAINDSEPFCRAVWDGLLCWPSSSPNRTVYLACPQEKGLDTSQFASRRCDQEGKWAGRDRDEISEGWTNYTSCFTPEVKSILDRLYRGSSEDIQIKLNTARSTRAVEMVGLSLSLTALIASLYVFFAFRCLKNKRTKLHRNLFLAMFLQVSVRLIVYVDQWLARRSLDDPLSGGNRSLGIENTMILCEVCYAVMEYARTCVFTWMFLEGIHLHTTVVLVFRKKVDFLVFHLIGWGFPLFLVLVWGTTMAVFYRRSLCWWGYHFSAYFWILEGPRMFIIMVNLVVLLNVVRVVMIKVQKSVSNEFQQIRKTIRAALLLLPLLGITNLLDIIPGPLDKSPVQFAVWSYTTHILSSFQGFFLSLLYCFLNREVKQAMKKHWSFIKFSYFNGIERKRIESRGHFNLTFISHLNSFRANIEDGPVLEEERETATL